MQDKILIIHNYYQEVPQVGRKIEQILTQIVTNYCKTCNRHMVYNIVQIDNR